MKVSVILPEEEAQRFNAYCLYKGYKKSTLIVRLIREYMDREQFIMDKLMLAEDGATKTSQINEKSE